MASLLAIPQAWVETYRPLPVGWWSNHAEGIERVWPECAETVDRVAREVGVDPRLLVTRMELEQSAISYRWDGSTSHYGGGHDGDALKIKYLCGVDRTDSGDRPGGWFGAERQLLGCALRFRYWYRGEHGPRAEWRNWLGLGPTNTSATLEGVEAANVATAMCYRYTPHLAAGRRLREIGLRWFAEDYGTEEGAGVVKRLLIWLDPGHGTRKRDGTRDTGTADTSGLKTGLAEKDVVMAVARRTRELLTAQGHDVRLTHERSDYSETMDYSDRGRKAVGTGYDCYISLHLDSSSNQSVHGTTVFIPKTPSNSPASRNLAEALAYELTTEFGRGVSYASARPDGVMPHWYNLGTFVGGGNNYSPGALALPEPLFMSNREDMEIIRRPDFVDRYASAVCRGILRYAGLAVPDSPDAPDIDHDDEPPSGSTTWTDELVTAAKWAREQGISDGTRLSDPLTRAEALVMLRRLETREGEEVAQ